MGQIFDTSDIPVGGGYSLGYAFTGNTLSVSAQDSSPRSLVFNNDGTKMFLVGGAGVDVNEYTLSVAYEINTASFVDSFSVSSQDSTPRGIRFSSDGSKMFIAGGVGSDINEYTLSTAWDVSTASFVDSFSVASEESNVFDVTFNTNGTKMFVLGAGGGEINVYDLSTGFDVSTASFSGIAYPVNSEDNFPTSMVFSPDGLSLFVLGGNQDIVSSYVLSEPFDMLTCRYSGIAFSVTAQDASPQGLAFNDGGSKMFIVGGAGVDINEYASEKPAPDLTIARYTGLNFSIASQEPSQPWGIAFKPDGLKMYMVGTGTDTVYQYSLTRAYDLSSASYDSVSFSVASEGNNPRDLEFSPDGLRMYVIEDDGNEINEYALSTAWDVSTASYTDTLSIGAQETEPHGLTFNSDGTKLFVVGTSGDDVNEYTLSTAWDVSTASFVDSFSVSSQETIPYDVKFNADGTKMFVGGSGNTIYQYNLTSPFDVSTASYASISFNTGTTVKSFVIANGGAGPQLLQLGGGTDIRQYTV